MQLKCSGAVLLDGDFNAHIGNNGGPRSFTDINDRGRVLIPLLDHFEFVSLNSQQQCKGPIETFYSNQGTIVSTIDHIFVTKEHLPLIKSCYIESDNLSYHLPIFCSWDAELSIANTFDAKPVCFIWKAVLEDGIRKQYQNCIIKRLEVEDGLCRVNGLTDIDSVEREIANVTKSLHAGKTKL